MGNTLPGKRRTAKVMKVDGTTFRLKVPAVAADALRGYTGFSLLESDDVKRSGLRARPLEPYAALKPGKVYFLVEMPRAVDPRTPRRTWSGQLQLGAKERLENLMLSRRSESDVHTVKSSSMEPCEDGSLRLRMRLPKSEVARLMRDSRDVAEAAEKIMQLCVAKDRSAPCTPARRTPETKPRTKEKRTRFVTAPDEIIPW